MNIIDSDDGYKCCCSCKHDIRSESKNGMIINNCGIDGHYIGYVACFGDCCEYWEDEDNAAGEV